MNTLAEIDQSVLRPVAMDVVSQIKAQVGINKNTPVYFPGGIGAVVPPGSEKDTADKENTALFAQQKAIHIEVEQDYDLPDINCTPLYRSGSTPIFIDRIRNVVITPIYFNTDVTIRFRYVTHSKSEAFKWRDDMRLRASQHGDINLHTLNYHYPIPEQHLLLLKDVYELKNANDTIVESFQQYLRRYFDLRMTIITDKVGQDFMYVIKERQARVQGIYDFDAVPDKPNRDDGTTTWSIEFGYKFTFERPSVVRSDYPVMVHQSLMPMKYLTYIKDRSFDHNTYNSDDYGVRGSMRMFESDQVSISMDRPHGVINIPEYDLFNPAALLVNTAPVVTVLCSISNTDRRTLFNLNDLGDITIDPDVLKYIREGEHMHICKPYRTAYTLSLYKGDVLMPTGSLQCDSGLNISSIEDLDITQIYRVVLFCNIDASMVAPDALERMVNYPNALNKYIEFSYNNLNRLTGLIRIPIRNRSDLAVTYWLLTGKSLFGTPPEMSDHPNTLPGYLLSSTNMSKELRQLLISTVANAYGTTVNEIAKKYGPMSPQLLLALRNKLTVTPNVARVSVLALRKENQ